MAKWGATSLVAMTAAVAILAGDHYRVLDRMQARDFDFPQRWGVAEVHPEFGEGIPSELREARIAEDGTLQVLSSGGACDALAGVEVEESDEIVRVTVRRSDVPVPACTADIRPWFADIPLDGPLDGMTRLRPRSQVDVGCRSGERFRLSGRATVAGGLSENPAYECWS